MFIVCTYTRFILMYLNEVYFWCTYMMFIFDVPTWGLFLKYLHDVYFVCTKMRFIFMYLIEVYFLCTYMRFIFDVTLIRLIFDVPKWGVFFMYLYEACIWRKWGLFLCNLNEAYFWCTEMRCIFHVPIWGLYLT